MTRQKKSRKAAPLGPAQKPRQKQADKADDKRGKKQHRGLEAGNRNNPEVRKAKAQTNQANKSNDPRHGSKKPISLTPVEPVKQTDFEPQIKLKKVKVVEPELTPEQELAAIENDERLMDLLDRADAGEVLSGKDAKYFNAKTARHQQLVEELGIVYEDDEDEDWEDDEDFEQEQSKSLIEQWEQDDDPKGQP
jgi:ribosome assembly protein YihI (activator of Der GTPase)